VSGNFLVTSLDWESFEHPAGGYRTLFDQSLGGLRTAL
jgi:hypothetical protein